jgi:SAM-dependent methyltransferase/uncharacterized protein YbaR (Trm112 family)
MLDPALVDMLVDPVEVLPLRYSDGVLRARNGAEYPVVEGVPVLLREDVTQTIGIARESFNLATCKPPPDPYFVETLGLAEHEKDRIRASIRGGDQEADPIIRYIIPATSGHAYNYGAEGRLPPIPIFPLQGTGPLLDIGCSWGRWCVAASRAGFAVFGIDPSLGAVLAGKRLAKKLGARIHFVCGDARFLPFKDNAFGVVHSYSVLQHFARSDVIDSLSEAKRVLIPGGRSIIQMARQIGLRSAYNLASRRFAKPVDFDVRYWTSRNLLKSFNDAIGPTRLQIDCFFGLGLQASDKDVLRPNARRAVEASEFLKGLSAYVPGIVHLADSVYCVSEKSVHPHLADDRFAGRRA